MVRFGERRQHLPENVHDAWVREWAILVLNAGEIAASQELHDEVELAVVRFAEIDDAY